MLVTILTGCGGTKYDMAYELNNDVSSFQLLNITNQETLEPFAADLCVVNKDVKPAGVDLSEAGAAALFDLKKLDTLYAKNVNLQINPASLTKVMTALVAIKYGSTDQMLTASENVLITEPGAQLCGLKPGDKMTLDQALRVLLIYSANDVAVLIAEGISGSVEEFVALMNQEAMELGATNCNFTNPNGLTEEGHYVTTYDLYLIFQEALKYDLFNEIIQMTSYSTVYTDASGNEKSLEVNTTNLYLRGTYEMPQSIHVIGGKTGTTNAAGHCLMLYSKGSDGTPYISIIMKETSGESLYSDMNKLLESAK
ncbi:MAG: D-alanyl-D-alanine carboxypeptidase [Lachnospiraceae bacterium]|nr:D-alanyl-D-alanine carboxypeptidase [Lachnospiraceae bacterium]